MAAAAAAALASAPLEVLALAVAAALEPAAEAALEIVAEAALELATAAETRAIAAAAAVVAAATAPVVGADVLAFTDNSRCRSDGAAAAAAVLVVAVAAFGSTAGAVAALPSSLNAATLQALAPAPSLFLVQSTARGGNSSVLVSSPQLTCTLAVAAVGSAAFSAAQLVALPPGTSLVSALTTAAIGAPQQQMTAAVASFAGVGLKGCGFAAAVPLTASCVWVTNEVITSQLLLAMSPPVALAWSPATLAVSPLRFA